MKKITKDVIYLILVDLKHSPLFKYAHKPLKIYPENQNMHKMQALIPYWVKTNIHNAQNTINKKISHITNKATQYTNQ